MRRRTKVKLVNAATNTGILVAIAAAGDMIAIDVMNGGPKKRFKKTMNTINGLVEKGEEAAFEAGHAIKKKVKEIKK